MSETKKYIFLHVPKTAGGSIRNSMPDSNWHNGPFAEQHDSNYKIIDESFSRISAEYIIDGHFCRPKEVWNRNGMKQTTDETAKLIEKRNYTTKVDHYTLEQYFETKLIPEEEFDKYFSFCFTRNPWDRLLSSWTHRFNMRRVTEAFDKGPEKGDLHLNVFPELWPYINILGGQKDIMFDKIRNVDFEVFEEFIKIIHQAGFHNKLWQPGFYYAQNYTVNNNINDTTYSHDIAGFGNHLVPQHLYAFDKKRNKKVDFIGRFENLEKDFKVVAKEIGLQEGTVLPISTPVDSAPPKLSSIHSLANNHSGRDRKNGRHYTEFYTKETRDLVAEIYAEDIKMFGYKFGE